MSGMVTFKNAGRCGNFLFQAATAMAYAMRHGLGFTVPTHTKDAFHNPIYLQHLADPEFDPNLPTITIQEKQHTYQELPFDESWREKNIVLDGWWQTEKYFEEFREEILVDFNFPWKQKKGWVSVHVRRGDYLRLTQKHPPVPKEWYLKAMEMFPGYKFRFFSDEPLWCNIHFGRRPGVTVSMGKDIITDLVEQSWCEHHICSASTYSWWAAWLDRNPDKKIVIPDKWFQPGRPEDTSDIVPETWTKLPL